jgi:protoporphyrin/coproporphyrin ferrochelatase
MSRYLPEPAFRHDQPEQTAVLLVNLGTPTAPEAGALRRYLRQFLADPRVVEVSRWLWLPILHGIILNTRPRKSARKYACVWEKEGSPLRVHTERQAKLLKGLLYERGHHLLIEWAMRYGEPAIGATLSRLKAANARRILIVPLYPQYAASTTAAVIDNLADWLKQTRNQPEIRTVRNFHDDPGYLAALEAQVRAHWQKVGRLANNDRLLISFHGLPQRSLELGDPYFCECQKTGRLLAERLSLAQDRYRITFQSRFGGQAWLQPYTAPTLANWGKEKIERVDVICPGFVGDCLETLEEIAIEGKAGFLAAGGREFHYIPALNEGDEWIAALAGLVERHLAGWPPPTSPQSCAERSVLARGMGRET